MFKFPPNAIIKDSSLTAYFQRSELKQKEGTSMWAYNETFYQIYPIGFCGAPVHNDGVPAHRILNRGLGGISRKSRHRIDHSQSDL